MPEEPGFVVVGRILAPWGVRGEVKVEPITDFPDRFSPGEEVYVEGHLFKIEGMRCHKGKILLKLATVDDFAAAEKLRGLFLEIPETKLHPLAADEYYHFQLIGLEVRTTDGRLLGDVVDIIATGSNDVYVVRGKQGELLIPAIEDIVKSVELDRKRITVKLVAGLLRDEA